MKVLISAPYLIPTIEDYRSLLESHGIELVIPTVNERLDENELLTLVGEIDGAVCGDDHFTERVLRAAPRLKVIAKWGTGIDSIDQAAARQLGIAVRNTPGAFTDPVADSVIGYVLCFARQLPWMDRDIRQQVWRKRPGVSLRECTLGVIGVGNIGKAVVKRAVAFGMQVLGDDIVEIPTAFLRETGLEMVAKDAILSQADFICTCCDLNPGTHHLIGARELESMKQSAYLINCARGPLVDEAALCRALEDGQIAGAALDVFEIEPLPSESCLRHFDNLLMAPHNANSSPEAWRRVHDSTIQMLLEQLLSASNAKE